MKCPRCQTANDSAAKFCIQCGAPLLAKCENCGEALPVAAKFCPNCGHAAQGEAGETSLGRLRQYVPEALLAKLEAARRRTESGASVEGERRVVSVLFCDVLSSTALAEGLDPEEWVEIMNGAFEYLISPVYRYEGTLARLMGDAILAFFGAPIAHEDDAQRAVLAALEIVEGLQPYQQQVKQSHGLDFNVRAGINTGLVVVGEVGSDLRVEYTAMGDAVNLAARMEQTAEPGTVQISEDTYKRVAPLFDCEPLGKIEARGRRDHVAAYRVLRPKARPGRVRGIEGLSAPLVGRQSELDTLQRSLDDLKRGQGGIVCLIGEAGLGKTRLMEELHLLFEGESAPAPAGYWGECRGVSYDSTRPYGLFQQQVRALCKLDAGETSETAQRKLTECLENVPEELRGRVEWCFRLLLGLQKDTDGNGKSMEGEALKRELFEVWRGLWRERASKQPTALVFDDLHWADPASLELLGDLYSLADQAPILFLCAFRPLREALSWRLKISAETDYPHRYREISLAPLDPAASQSLVESLLTVADLPDELRAMILRKSEGNPFFVEEVIRTLIERGAIVRDPVAGIWQAVGSVEEIAIPDSLQALLTARIDRLEEDARRTLQLAAVIGRSFYYRVLALISETAQELDRQLTSLQRMDLVREAARQPEREYVFRHALTQEAAYNSILLKRRRVYHRRVGEMLERLFPDRLQELAPRLADHFYEGEDSGRALRYSKMAGDAAYRLFATQEAIAHYDRAISIAKEDGTSPAADDDLLTHLYLRRGRSLELRGQYQEAQANYQEMEALALKRADRRMEMEALTTRATIHAIYSPVHNPELGEELLRRALIIARELVDRRAEAKILWNQMDLRIYGDGDQLEAIAMGEESIRLARELDLTEQLAYTLNDIHRGYMAVGRMAAARQSLDESRALWRQLGNIPMLSDNLTSSTVVEWLQGDFERARGYADEAHRLSLSIGNLWGQAFSLAVAGFIDRDIGQLEDSVKALEEAVELGGRSGFMFAQVDIAAELAYSYALLGQWARAEQLLTAALAAKDQVPRRHRPWPSAIHARFCLMKGESDQAALSIEQARADLKNQFDTPSPLIVGLAEIELALARGEHARALELVDEGVETLRRVEIRLGLAELLYLRGLALQAASQFEAALSALQEARQEAESLGTTTILWRILASLAELSSQMGNAEAGQEYHGRAVLVVRSIAERIGDPELRRSFLDLPHVHEATEGHLA